MTTDLEEETNEQELSDELEPSRRRASNQNKTTADRIDKPLAGTANGSDVMVVYDVEHLATFSTSSDGTCHGTTNSRSKQANNPISTNNAASNVAAGNSDDDDGLAADNNGLSGGKSSITDKSGAQFEGCGIKTPQAALRRLFELEKLSGIWTQRMQIELRQDFMLIIDCETQSVVEKFSKNSVNRPEAFNEYNHIYNNIVVFIIGQQTASSSPEVDESATDDDEAELHIFQCVSQQAQQLVQDILDWKSSSRLQQQVVREISQRGDSKTASDQGEPMAKLMIDSSATGSSKCDQSKLNPSLMKNATSGKQQQIPDTKATNKPVVTVASSSSANDHVPVVNVNVKETVQVFNQIAALREKSKPGSPTTATTTPPTSTNQNQRPLSDASATSSSSSSNQQSNGITSSGAKDDPLVCLDGASFFKQRSIRAKLSPQDHKQQKSSRPSGNSLADDLGVDQSSNRQTNDSRQLEDPPISRHNKMTTRDDNQANSSTSSDASSSNRSSSGFHHHHHQQQQPSKHSHHHNHNQSSSSSSSSHRASQDNGHAQVSASATAPAQGSSASKAAKSSSQVNRSVSVQQRSSHLDQVTTNESYVSVLNHCFDDIEKFILKLQQAMAASRDLRQAKRKLSKRSSSAHQTSSVTLMDAATGAPVQQLTATEMALSSVRARGPTEEDYFEILSKFKLAFNLLAKLKGCIHEPNAPELVHFLFTPLAIIIESARNAKPAIDPTLVGIPYLNQDALDLLSNCCTSKEYDMWMSLGPNWTQTIDTNLLKASRLPSSFQPIFSDGWAPIIGELELIGLVVPSAGSPQLAHESAIYRPEVDRAKPERQHRHRHRHDGQHQAAPVHNRHPSAGGYPANSPPMIGNSKSRSQARGTGFMPVSRHLSEPAVGGASCYDAPVFENYVEPAIDTPSNGATSPYRSSQEAYHRVPHHHRTAAPSNRAGSVERRSNAMRIMSSGINSRPKSSKNGRLAKDYTPTAQPYHRTDELLDQQLHYPIMAPDQRYLPGVTKNGLLGAPYSHHSQHPAKHRQHLYDDQGLYLAPEDDSGDYFSNHPDEIDLQPAAYKQHQHEAMLLDLGPAQLDWFYELKSRGAMIVRVLFSRAANNDKELSVRRGEILEILDDSRKWWRARNIELQVAHVPHTIVAPMQSYQTLNELLANNPTDLQGVESEDPSFMMTSSSTAPMQYARHPAMNQHHHHHVKTALDADDWHTEGHGSKSAAGAFRYF